MWQRRDEARRKKNDIESICRTEHHIYQGLKKQLNFSAMDFKKWDRTDLKWMNRMSQNGWCDFARMRKRSEKSVLCVGRKWNGFSKVPTSVTNNIGLTRINNVWEISYTSPYSLVISRSQFYACENGFHVQIFDEHSLYVTLTWNRNKLELIYYWVVVVVCIVSPSLHLNPLSLSLSFPVFLPSFPSAVFQHFRKRDNLLILLDQKKKQKHKREVSWKNIRKSFNLM